MGPMMKWALVAGAMMVPGAAEAADVTFTVHDVTLTATIPAGYCVPMNKDKLIADTLATGDKENITLATLIRCDKAGRAEGPGNDYMLIKTPQNALATRIPRAELLTALGAEFGKAEWQSGATGKAATADAAGRYPGRYRTARHRRRLRLSGRHVERQRRRGQLSDHPWRLHHQRRE
jgi:hypothetical protein